ncbi:GntR family transcriptional regulator [Marinobacter sp. F4216]|uniref:GntR family transcriptional regulator n=1 Tax=Marinobacter sp. F4216 TaxID=2874281 RepID=UPI001CBE1424|nr:GntR family transcriptional regulator [Marinobacter sp. F4216]MBZ2168804.1 GntR family transcriptional regulator [Marinobacter sp. F4216]
MPNDTDARRGSMSEQVYDGLKADFFAFRLMPGDRFSEGEVATRLHASRTPVREALYRLQREGYVEVLFRSGWRVRPFDPQQLDELFELRLTIELAALEKLCSGPKMGTPLRALLRFHAHTTASERPGPDGRPDTCFHRALVTSAGNREMIRIHGEVTERLRLALTLGLSQCGDTSDRTTTHSDILSALLNRDTELARTRLTQHIRDAQRRVQETFKTNDSRNSAEPPLQNESRWRARKY